MLPSKRDSYFVQLMNDLLYLRVCVVLCCLLLGGAFGWLLVSVPFSRSFWDVVGGLILILFELLFIWMIGEALFAGDRSFRRMVDQFDLGGADLFGIIVACVFFILVGIVAIPITIVARGVRRVISGT